ncbi:hypothetical protein HDV03_000966 [Kappamyces sp. JEL0829]|nr:hypothetical protein HDV03_000966 [Kappamyces sp. JEL0829]
MLRVLTTAARPRLAHAFAPARMHPWSQRSAFATQTSSNEERASIYFSIQDRVGALEDILAMLRQLNISLSRIESRPSKTKGDYDFYLDFVSSPALVLQAVESIKAKTKNIRIVSSGETDAGAGSVPWFPRKIADLDTFAEKVLSYGAVSVDAACSCQELEADHPGFTDKLYRERRSKITAAALKHKHGMRLPRVEYTSEEVETWGKVFNRLKDMYKTHACYEHQYIFPLLEQNCGYREDNIPQIEDVSRFLKDCTGWTIRPVMGLLSSRDFLNALAFRVFHSTQYIRHHSAPFYTPEPDICHELLGHAPLFADPDFAAFSHEIGLASLGASDEDLTKLATIYWFTVEFGLTRQGNEIKAYGAGLLSSFGELQYALSDKPTLREFDCDEMAVTKYPITSFQPTYFVASSFKQMKDQVKEFALKLNRPFSAHYNALTQSIEVLDTNDKIIRYANNIREDLGRLVSAIEKTAK